MQNKQENTYPGDSLAAYHRTLSNHLSNLLHSATNAASLNNTNERRPANIPPQLASQLSSTSATSSASLSKASCGETSEPTADTAQTSTIVTPPDVPPHTLAWKRAEPGIFALPSNFTLSLDHRRRSTTSREDGFKEGQRVKGLGIDLAITREQSVAMRMGLLLDPLVAGPSDIPPKKDIVTFNARRLMLQPSHESLTGRSGKSGKSVVTRNTGASPPMRSVSSFAQSDHPVRHHRRRSDEAQTKSTFAVRSQIGLKSTKAGSSLRDVDEIDKEEDYELRREMRLKKKQADLHGKVNKWRDGVVVTNAEMPEIDPTPPTPSIASGMLRLSPFTFASDTTTTYPLAPVPAPSAPIPEKTIPDMTNRLRAIDALLGDMSLIHPRLNYSPGSTAPLKLIQPVEEDRTRVTCGNGMPTPKASVMTSWVGGGGGE